MSEIINPGQLSKALAGALKTRGKDLSDNQLARMIADTEQTRADYQVKAILTGVALLAKKANTKHGKWRDYLERILPKNETRFIFGDGAYRMLALYMQIARRFLWKLESDAFAAEAVESDGSTAPVTATQIADLAASESESLDPVFESLQTFVAGRSLRRMLADFRQAEKDADAEERAGEDSGGRGEPGGEDDPGGDPAKKKPIQLLLWEVFQRDKAPILDKIFDEPGTEDLRGADAADYYSKIADELEARVRRARQLAEAAKGADA